MIQSPRSNIRNASQRGSSASDAPPQNDNSEQAIAHRIFQSGNHAEIQAALSGSMGPAIQAAAAFLSSRQPSSPRSAPPQSSSPRLSWASPQPSSPHPNGSATAPSAAPTPSDLPASAFPGASSAPPAASPSPPAAAPPQSAATPNPADPSAPAAASSPAPDAASPSPAPTADPLTSSVPTTPAPAQDPTAAPLAAEPPAATPDVSPPLVYQPISSDISSRFQKLTGEDVSSVGIAENPDLETQGKRGVAIDGECIEVAPGLLGDLNLCAHELTHIVQQRGPSQKSSPHAQQTHSDPESEAVAAASSIAANKQIIISLSSSQKQLFEEVPSPFTSTCVPPPKDDPTCNPLPKKADQYIIAPSSPSSPFKGELIAHDKESGKSFEVCSSGNTGLWGRSEQDVVKKNAKPDCGEGRRYDMARGCVDNDYRGPEMWPTENRRPTDLSLIPADYNKQGDFVEGCIQGNFDRDNDSAGADTGEMMCSLIPGTQIRDCAATALHIAQGTAHPIELLNCVGIRGGNANSLASGGRTRSRGFSGLVSSIVPKFAKTSLTKAEVYAKARTIRNNYQGKVGDCKNIAEDLIKEEGFEGSILVFVMANDGKILPTKAKFYQTWENHVAVLLPDGKTVLDAAQLNKDGAFLNIKHYSSIDNWMNDLFTNREAFTFKYGNPAKARVPEQHIEKNLDDKNSEQQKDPLWDDADQKWWDDDDSEILEDKVPEE